MDDFSQQLAEPPACGKSVVWGWGTVSGRCRAEKRGSRAQIWKPWAHISPLLTCQPIPTLTLRLFICEMEVSLIPAPHCHGDERTGGCGPTPRPAFPGGASQGARWWRIPCQFRRHRRLGLSLCVGKIRGEGNGHPFQLSCLGNSVDRGAWRATDHGVPKGQT